MKNRRRLVSAIGIGLGAVALIGGHALQSANAAGKLPAPTGKITPWAAIKIATGKVPGQALNANYEFDEGHWIYGVVVVTSSTPRQIKEVEIDPTTGKIGDVESITPAGEAKEIEQELSKALGKGL